MLELRVEWRRLFFSPSLFICSPGNSKYSTGVSAPSIISSFFMLGVFHFSFHPRPPPPPSTWKHLILLSPDLEAPFVLLVCFFSVVQNNLVYLMWGSHQQGCHDDGHACVVFRQSARARLLCSSEVAEPWCLHFSLCVFSPSCIFYSQSPEPSAALLSISSVSSSTSTTVAFTVCLPALKYGPRVFFFFTDIIQTCDRLRMSHETTALRLWKLLHKSPFIFALEQ